MPSRSSRPPRYSKTGKKRATWSRGTQTMIQRSLPMRTKIALNKHHFRYKVLVKDWIAVEMAGADFFFARNFKLSDLANYLELTNMFDQYRFNKVVYNIIPRQGSTMNFGNAAGTQSGSSSVPNIDSGGTNLFLGSNYGYPEVCTVIDYTDSTNPASLNALLEYGSFKRTKGNRDHKRILVPRIVVDNSSVGMNVAKRWIVSDNPGIPHYGIKGCIANLPNISPDPNDPNNHPIVFYDLELTFYLSFKSTR